MGGKFAIKDGDRRRAGLIITIAIVNLTNVVSYRYSRAFRAVYITTILIREKRF
jgi:hypothetical protein